MEKADDEPTSPKCNNDLTEITEGQAKICMRGKVFYNPVQEFNRDLSICVLNAFAELHKTSQTTAPKVTVVGGGGGGGENNDIKISINPEYNTSEAGSVDEDGITILEALSASGLRSIRYAKEVRGVKKIVANDLSKYAVDTIKANIKSNEVQHLVEASHTDAIMLMYQHRTNMRRFTAIDLDPYGCPTTFLDSAVQAVADGGLLLVTATDMAILAGNGSQTCYYKYGATSLRIKSCHEMALRILLQCIESHANRYSRYIEPVLSVSADFYIRVFVRIYTGAAKCKLTTSKLAMVYLCNGCKTHTLQPLGELKKKENNVTYVLPSAPAVNQHCEHCSYKHHMGGPIWTDPLHNKDFVRAALMFMPKSLKTWQRIHGVLNVILEELDVPLYYVLEQLTSTLRMQTPPMMTIRSAILNAGFQVSFTHTQKTSIKTDAPAKLVWDVLRAWEKGHPVRRDRLAENSVALNILNGPMAHDINFQMHPDANPESRKRGFVRFQENPMPNWGPGTRGTAMVGKTLTKRRDNQGKRKRETSTDSAAQDAKKVETAEQSNAFVTFQLKK